MKHHVIISIAALMTLSACGSKGTSGSEGQTPVDLAVTTDSMENMVFPLPQIPSTISKPEDQIGFIVIHFWDNFDFSDKEKSLNLTFMERNFVDYLTLIPAAMTEDRRMAFSELIKRASVYPETRSLIIGFGEKYLNDPDSPMKNAEYYADFVEAAKGS